MEDAAHRLGKYSIEFAKIRWAKRHANGRNFLSLGIFVQVLRQFAGQCCLSVGSRCWRKSLRISEAPPVPSDRSLSWKAFLSATDRPLNELLLLLSVCIVAILCRTGDAHHHGFCRAVRRKSPGSEAWMAKIRAGTKFSPLSGPSFRRIWARRPIGDHDPGAGWFHGILVVVLRVTRSGGFSGWAAIGNRWVPRSDNGAEDFSDTGRDGHGQRAPECHADRGAQNVGAACFRPRSLPEERGRPRTQPTRWAQASWGAIRRP